jgi:flagellar protein FliT
LKNIFNYFQKNPQVPSNPSDIEGHAVIQLRFRPGATMTSNEVLSMYESIAGLTAKMAVAAKAGDIASLSQLERQTAQQAATTEAGVPALAGAQRLRKIDLLKQIMANDRAIREVTEPWELSKVMQAAH